MKDDCARYTYATGYRTRDLALDAIEWAYAAGEVSACERPRVESYRTKAGARRYRVTLLDTSLLPY